MTRLREDRLLAERLIKPEKGLRLPSPRDVWDFRDLAIRLASRDLKLRYRQTVLGVAWVVLQPLLAAGIFSFVFGSVARLDSEGVPYFTFSYVGMVVWNLFSQSVLRVSGSLIGNAQLISKAFFPRLVLPLSTVGSTMVDLLASCAMGVVVLATSRTYPGIALITLPFWLVLAAALGTGIGLTAAALMVVYRDVAYILPVCMQLLLYGTPVAYSIDAIPSSSRWMAHVNPMAEIVSGARWAALGAGESPTMVATTLSTATAVACFLLGCLVFTRMERRFADVI